MYYELCKVKIKGLFLAEAQGRREVKGIFLVTSKSFCFGFPASLRLCERIFFWVVILKIKASPRGAPPTKSQVVGQKTNDE